MPRPHRFIAALAAVALAAGAEHGVRTTTTSGDHHGGRVLESDVFGSQPTGPTLFGVKPGGAPWVIRRGEAEVRRDGRVEVRVRGPRDPDGAPERHQPAPGIAATVFCSGTRSAPRRRSRSRPRATRASRDRVAAAQPCLAPAVLLNPR